LGIGQQPYKSPDNLQQVFPFGHSLFPSGQIIVGEVSLVTARGLIGFLSTWSIAGCLVNNGVFSPVVPLMHVLTSQLYPLGQQWTPSLQHTALGSGQQPYKSPDNLQQVFPSGHSLSPSGQTTIVGEVSLVTVRGIIGLLESVSTWSIAGCLFNNGVFFPAASLVHAPSLTSQLYPLGQQWTLSLQHTALGIGQQPYKPLDNMQQVFPFGHSLSPPGQIIVGEVSLITVRGIIGFLESVSTRSKAGCLVNNGVFFPITLS